MRARSRVAIERFTSCRIVQPSWTQPFEVGPTDTEPDGRLSLPALCRYLQDAAGTHATVNGISIDDLGRDNLTWVLGRLQLELEPFPKSSDRVQVTTWPSRSRSFFVVRDFLVEDVESGQLLSRATSTWFVIDRVRRRAVRVPQDVHNAPRPDRPRAMDESWAKLPSLERVDYQRQFSIGADDLDENDHVNNVRYLEWALATLGGDLPSGLRPERVEIDFLSELTAGASVVTAAQRVEETDGSTTVLVTMATEDGPEAARVRARWVPPTAPTC